MSTADIVARLRLNGEQFSQELRTRMGEIERASQEVSAKLGSAFSRVGPSKSAADSFAVFERAARDADRLVASIDPLFAAQMRYNNALGQANELRQTGALSGENYKRVVASITATLEEEMRVNQRLGVSMNQRRAGMQQLGFQIGDIAQQISSGYTPASIIFAQQSGQVIQAIQLMQGEGSKFLRFLGGPWGIALSAAAVLLAPFIGKLFDTRTELQKAIRELEENARKTELTRQAQEAYKRTLPGVIETIREQTEALQQQNRTLAENQELARGAAEQNLSNLRSNLAMIQSELAQARLRLNQSRGALDAARTDEDHSSSLQLVQRWERRVAALEARERDARAKLPGGVTGIVEANIPIYRRQAEEAIDPLRRLGSEFEALGRSVEGLLGGTPFHQGGITAVTAMREAALAADRASRERQRQANRDYSQVPFSDVRARIIASEAPASLGGYNAIAFNTPGGGNRYGVEAPQPLTTMTMGQILDFQRNVMRPRTRGHLTASDPRGIGSTGVGAYQFESRTLEENARLAFGPNWRDVLFSPGNQDRVAETLYNRVRGNPAQLRNTWAAFQPGRGGSGGDAATAANQAAEAANRELQARTQILQSAEQSTAQLAEQARLTDTRAQGFDREADEEEALLRVRTEAAERLAALTRGVDEMRRGGDATQSDVAAAEAAIAAQGRVTAGLEEQLTLYTQQREAYGLLLNQHREDGRVSDEELAIERDRAAQLQQTLGRAQAIGTTIQDNLRISEVQITTEHRLNATLEAGIELREKQTRQKLLDLEEQERELNEMKQDVLRRQEEQVRALADLYGDLFMGRTGDIWDRFKRSGLDVIAELAAQWTLAMMTGQRFNGGTALFGIGQSGNFGPIGTLLGGLFGKGGAGSAIGGLDAFMSGGQAAGGASGLLGGIGSAIPYVGAGFAAFGLLSSLGVFSSTKRGSATLGFDGGELGTGSTRGNSSGFIAASSSAMDSVGASLARIAEMLGGTVTGAGSVSLGQRDGNWRGDPTGRGITKTKKGAIDFGEDQQAAIRWAIGEALRDGVISGISDAAKRILQSGKDLEKAIDKAVMIESIPKLLKARLDPVGAALDELDEKWKKVIAALREGGASAEQMAQAQQLYKLELEDTVSKTASASASLKEFLDGLKMGPNSPYSLRDQEAMARDALQPYLDKIAAGEAIDQDKYQQTAQTWLDIERQLYGSTGQFFAGMDEIMAATAKAIERIDSAVPIRTAADPFIETTARNTGIANELLEELGSYIARGNALLEQIASNTVGPGSSTFIGNGNGFPALRAS